jgi:hypothetical protein
MKKTKYHQGPQEHLRTHQRTYYQSPRPARRNIPPSGGKPPVSFPAGVYPPFSKKHKITEGGYTPFSRGGYPPFSAKSKFSFSAKSKFFEGGNPCSPRVASPLLFRQNPKSQRVATPNSMRVATPLSWQNTKSPRVATPPPTPHRYPTRHRMMALQGLLQTETNQLNTAGKHPDPFRSRSLEYLVNTETQRKAAAAPALDDPVINLDELEAFANAIVDPRHRRIPRVSPPDQKPQDL